MKEEILYANPTAFNVSKKYAKAVTSLTQKEDEDLDNDVKNTRKINVALFTNKKKTILDGHHRLEKAIKYDLDSIPYIVKYFDSELEELAFVQKINLLRRNMGEAQKIINSSALFKTEELLAKQRQKSGTLASSDAKGKTSHKVAKSIGVSPANYEKGQAILKSGNKKIIEAWTNGKKKTSTAYSEIQFHKTLKRSPPLPNGIWNGIVIDLPIEYDNKTGGSMVSGSKSKYPTITWEQAFRKTAIFKKIIADDAVCFIWATTPHGKKYQEFLEKLGFKYSTKHYWIKTYPGKQMGMGHSFRGAVEELLIGYKGKARSFKLQEHNYAILPATEHSEKPIEYYQIMERAIVNSVGNPKFIELYNRVPQANLKLPWTFYGYNELEKKAILQ